MRTASELDGRLSRRGLLAAAVAGGLLRPAVGVAQPPTIMPRSAWGADLPPTGPLTPEADGDVRFLLVHHTASGNGYAPEDVPGLLRGFYTAHTGPKGWPDIAYNFLVDRFGRVWEGRAGSLGAPIQASATGGSQGFAQLVCVIGDMESAAPTAEAEEAVVGLLAGLAVRYRIDPSGTTSFVSRGSNRHPAGTTVTTPTIAGHRDMSQTVCPGRFGYELVGRLPRLVAARLPQDPPAVAPPTPTAPATPAELPTASATHVPERGVVPLGSAKVPSADGQLVRGGAAGLLAGVALALGTVVARRGLR